MKATLLRDWGCRLPARLQVEATPACMLTRTLLRRQVEEVLQLRRGECWSVSGLQVYPEASTPLEGVAGSALDVTLVLERCALCCMCHPGSALLSASAACHDCCEARSAAFP